MNSIFRVIAYFYKKYYLIFIFIAFFILTVISGRSFIFTSKPVLYGEFVNSTNFNSLYKDNSSVFNPNIELGRYNLGIPVSNGDEDVFGTARGIRTSYWLGFLALLQNIFKGFADKIYIFFAIIFPFISMFFLVKKTFDKSSNNISGAFIASLIYGINPWITERIAGGFLQFNIAYGILPLLFLFTISKLDTKKNKDLLRDAIIVGSLLSITLFLSPHFVIMFGFIMFIVFIFKFDIRKIGFIKDLLVFLLISIATVLLLTLFYLAPSYLYQTKSLLYQYKPDYFSIPALIFNGQGATLKNLLRLNPLSYLTINNKLQFIDYLQYIYILPLFLIFKKNRRIYLPFISIFIIGLFLAKGVNSPLHDLSYFLYDKFPILYPFRDPTKFVALMCFSISILWGYLFINFNKILKLIFITLCIVWLIIVNPKFISGNFGNSIVPLDIPKSYFEFNNWLSNQSGNFRVLYLPNYNSMNSYSWYPVDNLPSVNFTPYDALIPLSKPLADPSDFPDSYSSEYVGFLENNLSNSSLSYLLANKIDIKYIVLDNAFKTDSNSFSQYSLYKRNLKNNNNFEIVKVFNNLIVYENKSYSNLNILKSNKFIIPIVGDLRSYNLLESKGINFKDKSIVFLQQGNNYKLLPYLKNQSIFFINTSVLDLIGEELRNNYLLNSAKYVWNNEEGWGITEAYLWPYKSLYGLIFTSGQAIGVGSSSEVNVKFGVLKNGRYILLSKNLENPQGGILSYSINGKNLKTVDTKSRNYSLRWIKITTVNLKKGESSLKLLSNNGSLFIIDGIEIIPESVFLKKEEAINLLLSKNKSYFIVNTNSNFKNIAFTNLNNKELLYSYNSYWNIYNEKPIIGDFYANVFIKNKKGKLILKPEDIYNLLYKWDVVIWILMILLIIYIA